MKHMLKRISILLALVILLGGSGYLLSSKLHSSEASGVSGSNVADNDRNGSGRDLEPMEIPEGTSISVRLLETLSSKTSRVGDQFSASIEEPILVDGKEIVPRGAMAYGVVTSAKESGRIKGRSYISLRLRSIDLKNGNRLETETNSVSRLGASNKARNWALLGGGAGIGAGIGALAGGGKGVAIGGPVGFGAGLATKALIRGHEVTIPSETLLRFRLEEPTRLQRS
ncbi:MAG: hypothetical protein PHX83_05545 [Acidobacteriia bacterium]|nr:hypothetical protein [Terriglobia bacterium]